LRLWDVRPGSRISDPGSWVLDQTMTKYKRGKSFLVLPFTKLKIISVSKGHKKFVPVDTKIEVLKNLLLSFQKYGFGIRDPENPIPYPDPQHCCLGWARAPGDSVWRATGGTGGSPECGSLPSPPQHWHATLTVLHGLPGRDRYQLTNKLQRQRNKMSSSKKIYL
jgi:hypothetical protein